MPHQAPGSSVNQKGNGMDPLSIGLSVAPSVLRLAEGIFGDSPQEQYRKAQQENIRKAVAAINAEANVQRNREARRAASSRRLAKQGGARRAAAGGIVGDSDVYSNADVSNIDQMLNESISRINENQQTNVLRAESQYPSLPAYEFPNAVDYLSSGLESASDFFAQDRQMDLQGQEIAGMDDIAKAISGMNWGGGAYTPGLNTKPIRPKRYGLGYEGALDEQDLRLSAGG